MIFGLLFWKAGPFAKKAWRRGPQRIQSELDAAAEAKASAEAEAARIRQATGDIEAERSRLLAEADTQAEALLAEGRARLDRRDRRAARQGRRRHRRRRRPGHRRAAQRDRPPGVGCRRRASSTAARSMTRPAAADRGLHRTASGVAAHHDRTMSTHRRLRPRPVRGRPRRGHARRGRGRAVPLRPLLRVERRAAQRRSPTSRSRRRSARPIVEDLLGGKATPTTVQLISMVVGSGHGRDLPAIVDRMVERAASLQGPRPRRGPLGGRADRRPAGPPEGRAGQRHRQERRPQGRRRPVRARRPRRHRRRHRHRRHRPHPSRPVEGPTLMAELTLSASDIAAALTKNLEGFEPSLEARTVGRVAEVGDGIARVSGLPDAAVNELLEFEDGTRRPRPQPRRALDRRRRARQRRQHRGGPDGQVDRAASCRCPSATACSDGWSTPSASRSTARATSSAPSLAAWRSRRPASWAASRCTSRCRPGSSRSTR